MRTINYISAAALAAALFAGPQLAHSQDLGVDLNVGGDSGVDVDVDTGEGLDIDAGASVGGEAGGVSVDAGVSSGSSGSDNNLVDVDIGNDMPQGETGPNGGSVIDLDVFNDASDNPNDANLVDIDIGNTTSNPAPAATPRAGLITGDIRIGAIDGDGLRADALIALVNAPNLADVDLDVRVDDRNVAIVAVGDLLGTEGLVDFQARLDLDGEGRDELRDALNGSSILGSILANEGIDISDVLAVEVSENGATDVIVLDDAIDVALLGNSNNPVDPGEVSIADLDIELLSDEELALVDLDLLPGNLRTQAQLRLLGNDGDLADLSVTDLANVNLDLLSDEELAQLNVDLLPPELAAAIEVRLLGDDGNLADVAVGDLVDIDVDLLPGSGGGDAGDGTDGTIVADGTDGTDGTGTGGGSIGGNGGNGSGNTGSATGIGSTIGTLPRTQVGASFGVAALSCDVGVLALAKGSDASPEAIANARGLELVRIEGCERSLLDAQILDIRQAIAANPAISAVLNRASINLNQVVGATIQGGTLTLFLDPIIT